MLLLSVLFSIYICEWYYVIASPTEGICRWQSPVAKTLRLSRLMQVSKRLLATEE